MSEPSTREQVEMFVMLCQGPHSTQVRDGAASLILDTDAALRQQLAEAQRDVEHYRNVALDLQRQLSEMSHLATANNMRQL